MLERALAAHLPFAWVTGDSVYGADSALRRSIEAASKGYVLTVTSAQHLGLRPVGDWATEVPKGGWTRLSAGDGAKGPRLYDWACVPFRGAREGWQKALLIRRALEKLDELSFYLTLAPEGTELATFVQVAGTRWTIEACFEAAKGEVGLDEYEVRSWTGWHRHVTLAMLAHAYLAVVRQHAIRGRGPRPRGRLAAPHGSRGAPAHLAPGLGQAARPRPRSCLVGLAATTPAARQTITLDPQNQNSSTPAVVLSVYQLFHGEEAQTGEASFGEGAVQSFHGAQPPGSLRAEDSRTGQPFGDLEAAKFPVSPAARLPLDPNDASQSPSDPAVERGQLAPLAETEIAGPAPQVWDQLPDHPFQGDAPMPSRQCAHPMFEAGDGLVGNASPERPVIPHGEAEE